MAKHRIDQMVGKDHTKILQIGSITFAARTDGETGVWVMAKGLWERELRRAAR